MTQKVLIVEDEKDIADIIAHNLAEVGLEIDYVMDGLKALEAIEKNTYSLIVLDVNLPGLSGTEVCRRVREKDKRIPILMITARIEELDVVLGLEVGADDYMKKPFSPRELVARAKALLRRSMPKEEGTVGDAESASSKLVYGPLTIDFDNRIIVLEGKEIDLTATEFSILEVLAKHPGRTFERDALLSSIWGYDFGGYDNTLTSHMNRLRKKLQTKTIEHEFIETIWGVGYRFKTPKD